MLLLHRITPLTIGVVIGLGISGLISVVIHPLYIIGIMLLVAFLLLGRLVGWNVREPKFWMLVGIPFVFTASASVLVLFLESNILIAMIGIVTALFVFFFAEHLFTYIHVPARYQAYAIEHLSVVLNIIAAFYIAASAYGFRLFLRMPIWTLLIGFFMFIFFLTSSTFWVSKVEPMRARAFAFCGAIILTELFWAVMFLPTGFLTNAAFIATILYVYLGIVRAHGLEKLSRKVVHRYALIGGLLSLAILGTAQWV